MGFVLPRQLVEKTKRVLLKVGEDREITARFATLGVRDLDGDIIESGAIGRQKAFLGAWNHDSSSLPAGAGETYEDEGAALFKGRFFDTTSGRDHYETLKASDDLDPSLMEWSFRFFVQEGGYETLDEQESFMIRKARVTHVAPVESGAGIDTGTVGIKCDSCDAKKTPDETSEVNILGAAFDYEKLAAALAAAMPQNKGGCGGCKDKGDNLGGLLRTLRDEKELSNEDLAEAAGLSVETLGQMIGGTLKCPKASRLEALAEKLGVNLSRLVQAAELDGCGTYEEEPKAAGDDDVKSEADRIRGLPADKAEDADEPAAQKAADPVAEEAAPVADEPAGPDDTSKDNTDADSLKHQVEALMSGFPGLPPEIDPGLAAYERYMETIE